MSGLSQVSSPSTKSSPHIVVQTEGLPEHSHPSSYSHAVHPFPVLISSSQVSSPTGKPSPHSEVQEVAVLKATAEQVHPGVSRSQASSQPSSSSSLLSSHSSSVVILPFPQIGSKSSTVSVSEPVVVEEGLVIVYVWSNQIFVFAVVEVEAVRLSSITAAVNSVNSM